jgi:hypothetical protein
MATERYAFDLTTPERVKRYARGSALSADWDALTAEFVHAVSQWCERFLRRKIKSRSWSHVNDPGSGDVSRARLTAKPGNVLWLPNYPVTAISSLKLAPSGTALVAGYDQDFTWDPENGKVILLKTVFDPRPAYTEIVYTAGYLSSAPGGSDSDKYLFDAACKDLETSVIAQTAELFHKASRQKDGFTSYTTEDGTFQFEDRELLPWVKAIWKAWQRPIIGVR